MTGGGDSETAALLQRLERSLLEPAVRSSPDRVSRLIADAFVEFGSSGRVYDKAAVVAALAAEGREGPALAPAVHDFRVRLLAEEVALVTYRTSRSGASARDVGRSSIWKVIDGRWQMVFHQGTPIPSQAP